MRGGEAPCPAPTARSSGCTSSPPPAGAARDAPSWRRSKNDLLAHGVTVARLETGIRQPEALALYERCGYARIAPFGDYREDPLSVFLEKWLA